jgi:hypothetical protein
VYQQQYNLLGFLVVMITPKVQTISHFWHFRAGLGNYQKCGALAIFGGAMMYLQGKSAVSLGIYKIDHQKCGAASFLVVDQMCSVVLPKLRSMGNVWCIQVFTNLIIKKCGG